MITPLSVVDLTPVSAGATAADAVQHSLELARRAEQVRGFVVMISFHVRSGESAARAVAKSTSQPTGRRGASDRPVKKTMP